MNQNIKKRILIMTWSLAALILAVGTAWWWINYSQFAAFEDKQYKFTVVYPTKWKKIEHFQGTAVTFVRPKKTALDIFQPNVNITVQEVPEHLATLTTFSETITKQMTAVFGENIIISTDKDVRFANRPAHQMVFEAAKPNDVKLMITWTIKGSFAYIFTFVGQHAQYKEVFPAVQKMMNSFELK
jgi:hypothetical protein